MDQSQRIGIGKKSKHPFISVLVYWKWYIGICISDIDIGILVSEYWSYGISEYWNIGIDIYIVVGISMSVT